MTAAAVDLGPPYLIRAPRVLLRCFAPEDAAARKEAVDSSGEHLAEFFPATAEGPPSLEVHAAQVRRLRSAFDGDEARGYGVWERATGQLLGEVGVLPRAGVGALELTYWLRRDALGRGLATEAARALLRAVFEIDNVRRVDLLCAPGNVRSLAMARRLGFTLEGRLRDRQAAPHHRRGDLISFSLLAAEYPRTEAARLPMEALDFLGRPF